jgi:hypothetical protein
MLLPALSLIVALRLPAFLTTESLLALPGFKNEPLNDGPGFILSITAAPLQPRHPPGLLPRADQDHFQGSTREQEKLL